MRIISSFTNPLVIAVCMPFFLMWKQFCPYNENQWYLVLFWLTFIWLTFKKLKHSSKYLWLLANLQHVCHQTFILDWSIFKARFTNSLRQPKLSFGVKIVLSEFTKDVQWRISAEKAWTQLFAPDLIENAFEFPLPIYGRRVLKWITQCNLLTFVLVKSLVFVPLFNAPKKHVLKQAVICAALGRLHWSLWKWWFGCVCRIVSKSAT